MVPNHARYQLRYTRMCNTAIIRTFPHAVKSENGSFFKFFARTGCGTGAPVRSGFPFTSILQKTAFAFYSAPVCWEPWNRKVQIKCEMRNER